MAVTPNYSWPVPDDTDLVKDGAEAIRDLGNAIDTTVDGLPSGGLVHIVTTNSGGAVTTFSIDDVFSSAYRNYKVFMNYSGSADQGLSLRMRVAGSDNSTSNSYVSQFMRATSTTLQAARSTSTSAAISIYGSTLKSSLEITFYNPFLTVPTAIYSLAGSTESAAFIAQYFASHNQSTSYDGFTLLAGGGSTTTIDSISVYGLKEN